MHTPSVLALLLTSWNLSECTTYGGINSITSDRVAVSIAFAIVIECLFILSLSMLAWIIITPGIILLVILSCYRAFLGVKDMQISPSKNDDFFFSSGTT